MTEAPRATIRSPSGWPWAVAALLALVAFLVFGIRAFEGRGAEPPAGTPVERGRALYSARLPALTDCARCHEDGAGRLAPPLDGIAARLLDRFGGEERRAREWLVARISNPRTTPPLGAPPEGASYPDPMPAFGDRLVREELEDLAAYLMTRR